LQQLVSGAVDTVTSIPVSNWCKKELTLTNKPFNNWRRGEDPAAAAAAAAALENPKPDRRLLKQY
jgi:hypothetical protein